MATLYYRMTVFGGDDKSRDSYSVHGSKENAIQALKIMTYELVGSFIGDNYEIEEMTDTSFYMFVQHEDGSSESYSLNIE